uniref:K Homology domain-containing protein n=1 Tax=Nomascus leucogenys TaxID=61853 RepID=A0A2I3H5F8_NOMLE
MVYFLLRDYGRKRKEKRREEREEKRREEKRREGKKISDIERNSLKRLQEETGAKMSILGKGSMRDKAKEEELRKSGEAKYAHLSDELHVLIEVFAPPGEAYSRMSHALEEIKKFLVPDYNDEIRQEQLRELSYLNGSEDSGRGRSIRGRGIRIAPTAPSRGRGGAIPPPPPPGRGVLTPRGSTVTRGALPVPPVARGVPTPRARGAPTVPGYRAPPPPAHEAYEEYVRVVREGIPVLCQFSKECFQFLPNQYDIGCGFVIDSSYYFEIHPINT